MCHFAQLIVQNIEIVIWRPNVKWTCANSCQESEILLCIINFPQNRHYAHEPGLCLQLLKCVTPFPIQKPQHFMLLACHNILSAFVVFNHTQCVFPQEQIVGA